jgi:hypothetical protein
MYENDTQTRVPDILAATLTFLPLAVFTVGLRLWVRTRMVNALGWDDVLIVFSLVRNLGTLSDDETLIETLSSPSSHTSPDVWLSSFGTVEEPIPRTLTK